MSRRNTAQRSFKRKTSSGNDVDDSASFIRSLQLDYSLKSFDKYVSSSNIEQLEDKLFSRTGPVQPKVVTNVLLLYQSAFKEVSEQLLTKGKRLMEIQEQYKKQKKRQRELRSKLSQSLSECSKLLSLQNQIEDESSRQSPRNMFKKQQIPVERMCILQIPKQQTLKKKSSRQTSPLIQTSFDELRPMPSFKQPCTPTNQEKSPNKFKKVLCQELERQILPNFDELIAETNVFVDNNLDPQEEDDRILKDIEYLMAYAKVIQEYKKMKEPKQDLP